MLLYPVLGDYRGEQVWLGGVKQAIFVLPLTYKIDQHGIVSLLISASLLQLCVQSLKEDLSLYYDVWITPTGDNWKHSYITSQTRVFFPGWLHARKANHAGSNGMKRLEQTACNYFRGLDGTGQNPDVVQMRVNKGAAFAYLLSEADLLIWAYEKRWDWEDFSCDSCSVVWSWTLVYFNLQKMESRMFKKFKAEHYKAEAGPGGLIPSTFKRKHKYY